MRDGYETPTSDSTYGLEVIPDPSSSGYTYPADFQSMMPGYAVPTISINVNQFDKGSWSTPEAYSWHYASNLTTNPQIDGEAAPVLGAPFAFGGVESNTVENFEMLGNQAAFQTPDVQNWGDVGFANFGGILGSAVASSQFGEVSYEDLTQSIVYGV